jgi:formylglycine-generating enzyme required for sulfatase activity
VDPGQVDYLFGRLLDARPEEVGVIRDALANAGHSPELIERLWGVVDQPPRGQEGQRLRAACALAAYAPEDTRWGQANGPVVGQLIGVDMVFLKYWINTLWPVRGKLLVPLCTAFRERKEEQAAQRFVAASILANFAADQADLLVDLIEDADERQFAVLFPTLAPHRQQAVALLGETVATALESQKTDNDKERLAKRQANAAVTLLRLTKQDQVWPLLKHRSDPRVRSYLIHRLGLLGADPGVIVRRLTEEQDVSVRRALLLSLGEFGKDRLPPAEREGLLSILWQLYREDPDPGLHGAAEWLLRQWKQQNRLKVAEEGWAKGKWKREEKREQIRKELVKGKGEARPQWYVNGQGQTMVVIPGPVEFLMGSPPKVGRVGGSEGKREAQHRKRIGRSYAIAAKEVTVEQFLRFHREREYNKEYSPTVDCPMNAVSWYDAAEYCNWLSEQEGIPEDQWCYRTIKRAPREQRPTRPSLDEQRRKEFAFIIDGIRLELKPNYLTLEGYRLPYLISA